MDVVVEQAVALTLLLSLVPLGAIALCGGVVGLVQSMLQVQDQSLLHLVRVSVMAAALLWGGGAAFSEVEGLFVAVVGACSRVGEGGM